MAKINFSTVSFCILWFITIQLIAVIEGQSPGLNNNTKNDINNRRSGRSERSVFSKMPKQLRIRVQDENGQGINLIWNKQHQTLANKHLPIALTNGYLIRNAMTALGEFVVYHDFAKCSAVVYYEKTKTLSGNVGLEFTITDLPYEFDRKGNYLGTEGHKYISKNSNPPAHIFPQIPNGDLSDIFNHCDRYSNENIQQEIYYGSALSKRRRIERDFDEENYDQWRQINSSGTNSHRERREMPTVTGFYYLEVLAFISRDVVDLYKNIHEGNTYIGLLVKDYIVFFNIIDMMFNKLTTWETVLKINLAKIVIEDGSEKLDVFTNDGELLFEDTVGKRRENLETHQHFYPRDSYDYVFISTSRRIKTNSIIVPGKTDYEADLYKARQLGRWFKAVPVTILGYFEYPVLAVHEIAQTFNIKLDPWNIETGIAGQCYAIMQQGSSKCSNCLKWSKESSEQFQLFFRENRNRCFLLNEPRSLRRAGARKLSTLKKQCQCYGYNSVLLSTDSNHYHGHVEEKNCDKPLRCLETTGGYLTLEETLTPFDGTPCGGVTKVCWDGHCTPLFYV